MKLIELLVRELPKRGGWPYEVYSISQFSSGELCYHDKDGNCSDACTEVYLTPHEEGDATDWAYGVYVTREQYEAALAAAQQPVWDGEGLPPVGCEVEFLTGILGKPDADDNKPENGQIVRVVAHTRYENTGNEVVVATWLNGNGGMRASVFSSRCLQHIRSEADKKRDEIIESLAYYVGKEDATDLYAAIAIGNIKGVKLDV